MFILNLIFFVKHLCLITFGVQQRTLHFQPAARGLGGSRSFSFHILYYFFFTLEHFKSHTNKIVEATMHQTLSKTCHSCDTWNVPPKNQHKAKHSNQSEQKPSIDGHACPRSFATQELPINLPSMRCAPMPKPLVGRVEKDSWVEKSVPILP